MNRKPQDEVYDLYKAAEKYVKSRGGMLVVAGGIQIQHWPGDKDFNYTVAIKCTGRPPEFKDNDEGRK